MHETPDITTVQAGLVMSITYNLYALDKIGTSYCAEAVQLAEKLQLFDPPRDSQITNYRKWAGDSFTAWNLFFWTRFVLPQHGKLKLSRALADTLEV